MIPQLEKLTDQETELMYKAPLLVTILIAGADDNIDKQEKESALLSSTFNYQTFVEEPALENYYKSVTHNFMGKLNKLIKILPPDSISRNSIISEELEKLNVLFPKLDPEFAQLFYESLRNLANEVAKSSGGFLGIGTVSTEEKKLMALSMIRPPV